MFERSRGYPRMPTKTTAVYGKDQSQARSRSHATSIAARISFLVSIKASAIHCTTQGDPEKTHACPTSPKFTHAHFFTEYIRAQSGGSCSTNA